MRIVAIVSFVILVALGAYVFVNTSDDVQNSTSETSASMASSDFVLPTTPGGKWAVSAKFCLQARNVDPDKLNDKQKEFYQKAAEFHKCNTILCIGQGLDKDAMSEDDRKAFDEAAAILQEAGYKDTAECQATP